MNRRGFLGSLTAVASVMVMDPEKLLWRPGERTVFIPPIPKPAVLDEYSRGIILTREELMGDFKVGDIIALHHEFVINPVTREVVQGSDKYFKEYRIGENYVLIEASIHEF